jgi:hypothetical protein
MDSPAAMRFTAAASSSAGHWKPCGQAYVPRVASGFRVTLADVTVTCAEVVRRLGNRLR